MSKSTEERDAIRESNRRRANCSKCGGTCERVTGLDDDAHFPSITYKRCTCCGNEVAVTTRKRPTVANITGQPQRKPRRSR